MRVARDAFPAKGGPRSPTSSRDDVVAAEFNAPTAAAGYAGLYEGSSPAARFFRSRVTLISQALACLPGGDLLDVGCGPGMMVRQLSDSRPGDFRIVALDRSLAMVESCARMTGVNNVHALVGRIEAMPFADDSFDVVLAMGVLEYTELGTALGEIARVVRPDGLVLVTMLNPVSPYRFVEWYVYWPLLRALGAVEALLNVSPDRRHGPGSTAIHTCRACTLRKKMASASLRPVETVYFDVNFLVPPMDRFVRRWARGWRQQPERTIGRSWRKWLGSAYMVAAARG